MRIKEKAVPQSK